MGHCLVAQLVHTRRRISSVRFVVFLRLLKWNLVTTSCSLIQFSSTVGPHYVCFVRELVKTSSVGFVEDGFDR